MNGQASLQNDFFMYEEQVGKRIRSKIADYDRYGFTSKQSCALNVFFDLAQEYEDLHAFHVLPVQVLKHFFSLDAEFYVRGENGAFRMVTAAIPQKEKQPLTRESVCKTATDGKKLCLPVRGRFFDDFEYSRDVLGVLVIYPESAPAPQERLFLEKFANRLGYSMHNRILAEKDKEHLAFTCNLVQDIGHNVIGPNMHFKLLINQLEGKIAALGRLGGEEGTPYGSVDQLRKELNCLHQELQEHYQKISHQFQHTCLFLESLLRESHFAQGHFVLRPVRLNLVERVVKPQFEHYLPQFLERGIKAELRVSDSCHFKETEADLGLLSQVLANLLANAVKYTGPDSNGEARALCLVEEAPDALGPGLDGIKVGVLTTGPHIEEKEAALLFEKYFRASNTAGINGTGSGLHFAREIILAHQGLAFYTPDQRGNMFSFILPE